MADELAGKVAIITGGGRGIGRGIALRFAAAGAAVVLTSRSRDQLDETVALVKAQGGRAISLPGDVSDITSAQAVNAAAEREFGPVDVLVNNAGITGPFGPLWELDAAHWWQAQEVHLKGAVNYIRTVGEGMVARGGGHMITVVSGAGLAPRPFFSGYGVAKAAQIRLMETLALEGKDKGLICFAMSPGLVVTELGDVTMDDPNAQKYLTEFVVRLKAAKDAGDYQPAMDAATGLCLTMASGAADALSGRHFSPTDDIAAAIREATAG